MPVSGNGTVVTGLGGPKGYGEIAVPRSDDGSLQVDVSSVFTAGFNYFGTHFTGTQFYVNTNGTVSFGTGLGQYPTNGNTALFDNVIALFWADVDTRIDGEGAESGQVWVDLNPATGTVTITWENVGSYRRNADLTDLFQLQLIDRGNGDFDIVIRYENIDWTTGSSLDDAGARAIITALRLPETLEIGTDPATLDTTVGNTGVTGMWVYEIRNGGTGTYQPVTGMVLTGTPNGDVLEGAGNDDLLRGLDSNDILRGNDGNDWLYGGDGADTLNGGAGDDFIFGGETENDLRDVIYAGDGNDTVDAGYGNDLVYGGNGNDTINGGFGSDELIGQGGNDVINGAALSDLIFGGDGDDFINGGFGYDRLNGGAGADRFYHRGIADHGSDWIQDYSAAEGDVLVWGGAAATASDFQVNYADTAGAGAAGVSEAFVIYKPTGQIIWALVDGDAQTEINIRINGIDYNLLA
ncbi:nidogen-like domain-containing protein [Profundibacter sp.]